MVNINMLNLQTWLCHLLTALVYGLAESFYWIWHWYHDVTLAIAYLIYYYWRDTRTKDSICHMAAFKGFTITTMLALNLDLVAGPSMDTILFLAVNQGRLAIIRELVATGIDIRPCGSGLVITAAANGHLDTVIYLTQNNIYDQAAAVYAFIAAASKNYVTVTRYLYVTKSVGDDCLDSALVAACGNGHCEMAAWLLRLGAKPTAKAVRKAYRFGGIRLFRMLYLAGGDIWLKALDSDVGSSTISEFLHFKREFESRSELQRLACQSYLSRYALPDESLIPENVWHMLRCAAY